jgi:hypothetical protein
MSESNGQANVLEEDGFYEVTLKGKKDGQPVAVMKTLDLYHVHNELVGIKNRHGEGDALGLHAEVREYMEKLEFPPCSDRMADRFMRKIFDAVADLQKKSGEEPRPASPASTESAPGVAVP